MHTIARKHVTRRCGTGRMPVTSRAKSCRKQRRRFQPSASLAADCCWCEEAFASSTSSSKSEKRSRSTLPPNGPPNDFRHAAGTSSAPAARNSSTEIKCGRFTNGLQQLGLARFHLHQERQDVEYVQEFGRIFGQPVIGLNLAELRGRPAPIIGRFCLLY